MRRRFVCAHVRPMLVPATASAPAELMRKLRLVVIAGSLVAHARAVVAHELHELRTPHDCGAFDEAALVELALLEARRAHVDLAARLDEALHELLERREAFLVDRVG